MFTVQAQNPRAVVLHGKKRDSSVSLCHILRTLSTVEFICLDLIFFVDYMTCNCTQPGYLQQLIQIKLS